MGWGITGRVPPDKEESEIKINKSKNKITKQITWKDKPTEKTIEKLEELFNESGESQRVERADRGGDGQRGTSGTGAEEQEPRRCRSEDGQSTRMQKDREPKTVRTRQGVRPNLSRPAGASGQLRGSHHNKVRRQGVAQPQGHFRVYPDGPSHQVKPNKSPPPSRPAGASEQEHEVKPNKSPPPSRPARASAQEHEVKPNKSPPPSRPARASEQGHQVKPNKSPPPSRPAGVPGDHPGGLNTELKTPWRVVTPKREVQQPKRSYPQHRGQMYPSASGL